jgi:quercetin dioxygenase-like cupin family protein
MFMKENSNEPTSQRPDGDRKIDGPLVSLDLPLLMEQIKEEKSWKDGKRNAITVFKANELNIVLIALHGGSEMARHVANGIISVQVLEGRMQFKTDQQSVELGEGQMLVLHEEVFHSVKAIHQTIFLLTVTNAFATKKNYL